MLKDETHAEELLSKISDRLMASDSTSLFVLMKNLLLTLLDGISSIGTTIPSQFLVCIDLIKRFLLVPAPSLVKLKESGKIFKKYPPEIRVFSRPRD